MDKDFDQLQIAYRLPWDEFVVWVASERSKAVKEGHKAALESAAKIARDYPCYSKTLPCGTEIASMILEAKSESDGGN